MSMKVFSYVGMFLLLFRRSTCFDHTVVVPKAFRIDAPEKVILNLHGYHKATVSAYMQDLPFRRSLFSQIDRVVLSREEAASPVELTLMVKATDIETFRRKQTVDVVIEVTDTHGKDFTSHTEVLVSKQSGYVYVITDRPAYKPQEHVNIKVFPLSQAMKPDFSTIVSLSVKTPDGITVQKHYFALPQGDNFVEDLYEINQNPLFGKWSVEAKYAANGYKTTTETHFVIQRYVLPAFQVLIHPKKNFILATDKTITGEITATYSYGKPVSGNYFLTMKLKMSSRSDVSIPFYKKPKDFHAAVFRGGKRTFEVQTSDIKKVLAKGDDLSTLVENQASIFIEATVNDFNTGIMESAISPNIPFVSSPYIIDTKTTSPYFTPTLSYQLRVNVHFAIGGKLAPLVDVKIQVQGVAKEHKTTSNAHGEVKALLDFSSAKSQVIIIKTADVTLSNKIAQAEKRLTIRPYQSSSKSYLQIKLRDDEVKKVNQNIQITFSVNAPNPDQIRYYVLARGTIVHTGMSVARSRDKVKEITESISITQEMVPSARIVAYYIRGKELVSDSIWFDVEDRCKTELALEVPEEVLPGSDISIGVTGSSGALVSIAGVDKAAYFLYNESRLTRDRMFDEMESYDQGCTRSGGENTKSVFMDAGLYISSRNLKQLPVRTLNCSMSRRRRKKREVISEERLNQMKLDASLDKCKLDGKQFGIITNDTCLMRWKRCEDDEEDLVRGCCKEFLSACYKEEKEREKAEARAAGRSLFGGAGGVEANLGRVRENFHESLMFTNIKLNGNGKGDYQTSAKDQITTFDIDAVSMQDSNDGFCVANTAEMRVFKHVFLKLITPYSLRKLEQTNLRISVFNYHKTNSYTLDLEVKMEDKSICTRFTAGVWRLLQRIQMQPESSVPAHLTIIPLKTGSFPIFLRLRSVEDGRLIDLDTIKKEILIEESGEIKDSSQSFAIDLVSEKRQVFDIHLAFPENIVANTRQCWLYAYADFLGPSIEVDPVTEKPRSVESIFRKPYGCGEQNMLVSGPNVYTHAYLASIGVIINGTLKFRESVKRIREGYELELKHRSDKVGKRAFAVWRNHQPSTWLNAFVDKVFTKASEHIPNLDPICSSLEWLLTQQAPDFHFKELRKPIHREMHGAVGGKFTLTAYVAISLLETQERPKCSDVLNANIQVAVKNAVAFLKTNIHHKTFTRPYALALLSYTLALHDPDTNTARATFNRLLSLSVVENGKIHWNGGHSGQQLDGTDVHPYWYKRKPLAVNVETTAYALLAQIAMSKPQFPVSQSTLDRARKMVLWLVSERTSGGTFISTQDTVIGLQALATYETWIKALEKDQPKKQSEFSIQFSVPSHWNNPAPTLKINGDNIGERQEIEVPDKVIRSGQDIRAVATGQGEGLLSYRCTYRTVVEEIPCHFTIDYKIAVLNVNDVNPNREDRALMRIKFELTVSKEKGDVTQMAVVEVGILSGFAPVISSLDRLSKADAVDGIVDSYEVRTYKVILYLRRITNSSLTLAFHMVQNVEVNKPEPAKINVYDYYEPEVQCGLFYSLPGIVPDLRTANCDKPPGEETNGICKCAEGGCPTCRSHTDQLQSTACLSGKKNCKLCKDWKTCTNMYLLVCDSVINYVYEIKVKSLTIPKNNEVFHSFVGEVKKVLKYGSDEQVKTGSEVVFEMRSDCYRKCWNKDLIKNKANADWKRAQIITVGRQLTIMGIQPEEIVDRDGNHQNKYLLDEHAVVERKITEKKYTKTKERLTKYCPDSKIHNRCDDLEKIIQAYNNFETLAERLKQGCD